MNRKHFLINTLLAVPAIGLAKTETTIVGPSNPSPFVVDAGKSRFGDMVKFLGVHPNDLKISARDTDGQLSVFEYTGLGKVGPGLHIHFKQDEVFTVIEGTYRFVAGDKTHILGPGQTIFLPRGIPHTWIQLTDRGKLIYMLQPAGKMEEFFSYMNGLSAPPSPEELARIHEAHDMKVVGPPLTL
jgi:quercetin dioxygenase-like cupin family protein